VLLSPVIFHHVEGRLSGHQQRGIRVPATIISLLSLLHLVWLAPSLFLGKAKAHAQGIFLPIKLFFYPNQLRMSSISRVGSHSLPFHLSKHLQPMLEWDMSLVNLSPSCRHKVFIKCSRLRGEHLTRVAPCFSAWVEWFYFSHYYSINIMLDNNDDLRDRF